MNNISLEFTILDRMDDGALFAYYNTNCYVRNIIHDNQRLRKRIDMIKLRLMNDQLFYKTCQTPYYQHLCRNDPYLQDRLYNIKYQYMVMGELDPELNEDIVGYMRTFI